MKRDKLIEDRLPQKLSVRFSSKIIKEIEAIDNNNQNNIEAISQWHDYLDGIISYISNPVIAWDYTNRFSKFPNGARFIRDFDCNVGYTIKSNDVTNQSYIYVFMVNLKPREFGLKVPPNMNENKRLEQIISEVISKYLRHNLILN